MAIINQHINEFLDYYLNLNEPQYAVLLSGKWGSGKTHFIKQFKEKNKSSYKFVHVSLFGLRSKEDIHKQVIFKLFGLEDDNLAKATDFIGKFIKGILDKYAGVNIALSDIPIDVALKRETDKKVIFIFDDLERIDTGLSEVLGYINILVEELGQRVILLANEDEIKDRQFYDTFKEKTIGKTFQIEQDFDTAFIIFTSALKESKDMLRNNQLVIKTVFDMAGYKNLRSLRQGVLDFDRLMSQFELKFKTHSELMVEFIQIFFALFFEMKNGKFDILTLKDVSMLRVGKMLNDNKPNKELTIIEKLFQKYNFLSYELLLSNENWIDLLTKGNISATMISLDLNRSRYFFREQKEEWVMLWHYMWIEEDEFETALKQTLLKLKNNEYLEPTVIMQVLGIFLELIEKKIYNRKKDQLVDDIKKYVDVNIRELKGIYTLNDYELDGHYTYYGYRSEESDEFKHLKDYLLEQADNFRNEGLVEKGNLLIQYLSENKTYEFADMLTAERNKEILYRLPVFSLIKPQAFFDALLRVENKNMRDVLDVLKNRYQSISAYQKENVLEELSFWKALIEIINSYEVKIPYKIKDVWIKKHCHDIVEKEIIQKIENEIQHKKNIEQLEVTTNE